MQPTSRRSALSLAFTLAASTALGACGHAGLRHNVEPPQIQARMAQFVAADQSSVTVRVEVVAYNPNPFELYVRRMDSVLVLGGQAMENITITMLQELPPQQQVPVVANVTVPRGNIRLSGALPAQVMTQGLAFAVQGTLDLDARRHRRDMRVPFVLQGVLPPQLVAGVVGAPTVTAPVPMVVAPQDSSGGMSGGPSNMGQ